ncbi:hypothetical protein [Actinomadura bangladeshensis]|uniref:Uncharacterized protein n=1 Tax=Actinomadura bangladeshensis TaxID=453573 RepID=A0A6L9QCQ5_9ACTN|nr:hypothetical protein [Actinomadura bangladeshensis]NEA21984.1 hypothetical protein [Actinomadura bangladeshensis]
MNHDVGRAEEVVEQLRQRLAAENLSRPLSFRSMSIHAAWPSIFPLGMASNCR